MATPPAQSLTVICPGCAARFEVAGDMAGRKGRCARCNAIFRVPGPAKTVAPNVRQPAPAPRHISVLCRVCQTLMYGGLDQVGKPLKCPDCGAQTILPPQPEKPKKPLAAMEGEQYELWGVDEAPSVAEMLAAQPKYIAVECRVCQTLMQATEKQVGKKLKCPDCGTANLVPPPAATRKPISVLARDEDDLEIDAALDPGERPPVIIPPRKPMVYEVEAEAERKRQEERLARGDKHGPNYDDKGRAMLPRWPLATRIFSFLFTRDVLARWLALTLCWYLLVSPTFLASFASVGPIAAVPLAVATIFGLMIWSAGLAAIVMAIIVESSEGNDEVSNWPTTNPADWAGEFFYLFFACIASPLPGWLFGRLLIADPEARAPWFIGSLLVSLPVIILSQLDVGSAFAIASPRVIASFLRVPGTWLMFYVEMAVLMAACVGVTIFAALLQPLVVALLVPMYIAAILLAARILGRLAWKLAETMSSRE
jgi:DNA-directed RNA polymerase subunit M/transcription elongation factor TFIIS